MTVANAVKMLSKVGTVQHSDRGQYWAHVGPYVVSFSANGKDEPSASAICFHVQRATDQADSLSDYFPGSFFRNLTRAIRYAQRA